jgi:hypothetical protein
MNHPQLFAYPDLPHARKHGPGGYSNYQEYKDWLRDEFTFRCGYCLERELWYPSWQAAFAVEHILPQSTHPHLICAYENLLYACLRCNAFKQDLTTLNPTVSALAQHLRVEEDGLLTGLTDDGKEFILLLHLNERPALEVRRAKLLILSLKRRFPNEPRVDQLFRQEFGFPQDLPDLETKRPETNSRPAGLLNTYFRQRSEKRLPDVY